MVQDIEVCGNCNWWQQKPQTFRGVCNSIRSPRDETDQDERCEFWEAIEPMPDEETSPSSLTRTTGIGPAKSATAEEGGGSDGTSTPPPSPLRISEPGIYALTGPQYHADPCIVPSVSRSIIKILIDDAPLYARYAHPRLGNADEDDEESEAVEARDVGTAAHAAFLRGEDVVERVPFDEYRTKKAKELRDEILAAGRIPLKQTKYDHMLGLLTALEAYRARTGLFTKGKPEQTLIARLTGSVWGRAMVDWLPDDPGEPLVDLKTTSGRARVDVWTRRCFETGSQLQAPFYSMLAAEVRDGEMPQTFKYVVAETRPPFGIRTFELSPQAFEVAEAQVRYGVAVWERCIAEDFWPSYPLEPEWIDVPGYILRQWEWQTRTGHALGKQRIVTGGDAAATQRFIQAGHLGG